jgi:glycosyltransferase involved in cell wall biosynthesis
MEASHLKMTEMNVVHLFRKKNPIFFSIEKVFSVVAEEMHKSGIHITRIELPVYSSLKTLLKNILFTRKINKENLVHITGDVHYVALALPSKQTVLTIHDIGFLKNNTGFKKMILKKLWIDLPLNHLRYITVISQATKNELIKIKASWGNKIQVIHNPVNPVFSYTAKEFNKTQPRILHIGITPNKNIQRTIEALKNINCVIVFIGILPTEIKEILQSESINFEEKYNLSEEALVQEYQNCDVVSFCSLLEGFGLPIVEAQATGRVVVTSNLEPMLTVAGGGAIFADPYNIDSMRAAFTAAINDDVLREETIQKGFQNVRQYSAANIAGQYASLYQKIKAENFN